ncbi:hypothetical protein IWW34DRAFT_451552 [Fusarium oxysporum f. sp. albedinis]|uniref:Uncharacterized protein n=8 Tax=Fusarium oxysporum TaxID=5507 RepID=W9HVG4_FUSOX|nr:hypothetical protein FOXG_21267 [Fusarium oxysporum f. sp. lycopersici 4287]XP_018253208.1 hypothetical protein FOXG_21267 [Fusarium oxysporum f. sp. lycopersici 4287]XP_031033722.1 uncharacterized protein FOBCDRAFT_322767 [Fusarium oxysporum Fo47]EWY84804.1 hypothetical protein FOYG_12183 [Fusarium oxysporum NRRL 32931]EWZ96751.1 hypothetical protein FOWG_04027 [Fusarium oxysporum f. sp. lycopersici MN25]EXK34917.1 hypothetical protein FOMG_10234 [Fusarium oxysporum f. sp. melonis 26406]E
MPCDSTHTDTIPKGDTPPVTIDTKMLEPFIHDTSSLQDRLLMRSMAEDNKAIGNGAGYSGPKGSKL